MGRATRGAASGRVLAAACHLFYRDGIHAVGVDTLAKEAGVTKTALYTNFGSKDQLVVAYLRERDRLWQQQVDRIAAEHRSPRERVLAVFDAYDTWLTHDGLRGCAFLNAAAEFPDPEHPIREVVRHHKSAMLSFFRAQLQRLDVDSAETRAAHLMLLVEGAAANSTVEQDRRPMREARALAESLLAWAARPAPAAASAG